MAGTLAPDAARGANRLSRLAPVDRVAHGKSGHIFARTCDAALLYTLWAAAGLLQVKGQEDRRPSVPPSLFQSLKWRNVGPFGGGRSVAVAGVPSEPNTFYFGGVGGGVFKSTNAGETWANVSDGFMKTSPVGAIAVAPSDPDVIYVGMGEGTAHSNAISEGDGVYSSTDAGRNWVHLGLEPTRVISRIRVDPPIRISSMPQPRELPVPLRSTVASIARRTAEPGGKRFCT